MNSKRIFYVSSLNGDDKNDGTSKAHPFRSLRMINRQKREPGDVILLERGSVFQEEYLHIFDGGTKEFPVTVDAYGEGERPVIEAAGSGLWYQNYGAPLDSPTHVWKGYVSSAILLYDVQYITIRNIEITNQVLLEGEYYNQGDLMNRTGVSIVAKDRGTLHQIELESLYIHDVTGNVYDKHLNNGGIYACALTPQDEERTGIARYDGLHIHHCRVERCRRWGISAAYTYRHGEFATLEIPDETAQTYGSVHVTIEHNSLKDIGGDGITPMHCFRPLVQHNISENTALEMNPEVYIEAGERAGMTAAAIWPWKCKDALFQYNEAFATRFNQDGQAWDADSGDGTVYQYNYSHDNEGGCIMFCEGESVNNIFRYNISVNDGTGTITPVRNVDAHIYNNTFIIPEGVPFIRQGMSEGGMLVENNIIIKEGKTAKNEDWHHQTEKAVYHNNLYCNYRNVPEEDDKAVIAENADKILEDPKAVYEGFRLTEESPAVGKGKRIKGDAEVDFFGEHAGNSPDIGACFARTKKQN